MTIKRKAHKDSYKEERVEQHADNDYSSFSVYSGGGMVSSSAPAPAPAPIISARKAASSRVTRKHYRDDEYENEVPREAEDEAGERRGYQQVAEGDGDDEENNGEYGYRASRDRGDRGSTGANALKGSLNSIMTPFGGVGGGDVGGGGGGGSSGSGMALHYDDRHLKLQLQSQSQSLSLSHNLIQGHNQSHNQSHSQSSQSHQSPGSDPALQSLQHRMQLIEQKVSNLGEENKSLRQLLLDSRKQIFALQELVNGQVVAYANGSRWVVGCHFSLFILLLLLLLLLLFLSLTFFIWLLAGFFHIPNGL